MDYPCKACDGSGHCDIPIANGRGVLRQVCPSCNGMAFQSHTVTAWVRALKKLLNPSLLIKALQSQFTRWAVEARKLATPENFLLVVCLGVTAFCIGVTVFWAFTDSGLYEWLKQLQSWVLRGYYYPIYTGIVTFLALWLPLVGVFLLFQKIWFFFCQMLNRSNHKDKE